MELGIRLDLYTLVVQYTNIIPLYLTKTLLTPVRKIMNLSEAEKVVGKIFEAWGVLQCIPEHTVNLCC